MGTVPTEDLQPSRPFIKTLRSLSNIGRTGKLFNLADRIIDHSLASELPLVVKMALLDVAQHSFERLRCNDLVHASSHVIVSFGHTGPERIAKEFLSDVIQATLKHDYAPSLFFPDDLQDGTTLFNAMQSARNRC